MILADLTPPSFAPLPAVELVWVGVAVGALTVLFFAVLVVAFLLHRPLKRRQIYHRALRLLHDGRCEDALATIRSLKATGRLSELWQGRLQNTEGECERVAGDEALRDQRYEDGLEHYQSAAHLLGSDPAEARTRVVETMLAEIRRQFAAWPKATIAETDDLISRTLTLDAGSAEAHFWKALCHVREEQWDEAAGELKSSHEIGGKRFLDPPLYLGVLHIRLGHAQEAVRFLSEANRLDSACPMVTWQMGLALLAANGDAGLAVRALQRAVGPRGLGLWVKHADRMWQEAFPEGRSFVRRLAARHRFDCPLLGSDPAPMLRLARIGLAQAYYRQGSFEESAGIYGQLLQEAPPTVPLLRGLGLALTRLERYDQAFKHLRTAFEQEEPKNHLTAGYLALCGALGKPSQEGDKAKNVAWAIRLLARFDGPGDAEWARINGLIFAEARAIQIPVAVEDQVRLCSLLASVDAVDVRAAAAFDQLAATSPDDLRSEHAWLYSQASVQRAWTGSQDLSLLARTVLEAEPARAFFSQRHWDFDAIEYACLERHAAQEPGRFPDALGPDYHPRGESFLLTRSRLQDEAGQKDAAMASAEVLFKLAPASTAVHDRLAQLHYHRGNLDQAADYLSSWHTLEPANPWPLVRRAVIDQQRGQPGRRAQAIEDAIQLTHGAVRASLACLGARLALREARMLNQSHSPDSECARAERLLLEALSQSPDHVEALACLAALRAATGRFEQLTDLAPHMHRPHVQDARFHLLAAACHLAAGNFPAVLDAGSIVVTDAALAPEGRFLIGMAHLQNNDFGAAVASFREVTCVPTSASAAEARARLGKIALDRDALDEAITWWIDIEPDKRREWQLEQPLRQLMFLAGIRALNKGDYERAACRLVEARQLGCDDRRLATLLPLALVQAGQQLLFGEAAPPDTVSCEPSNNGQVHPAPAGIYRYRPATSDSASS
jgi:tetratricopeptide (TPR) repeat protein